MNSIELAQTAEELKRAFAVQANSTIFSIRLKESQIKSESPDEFYKEHNGPDSMRYKVAYKVLSTRRLGDGRDRLLSVVVNFGLMAVYRENESKVIYVVSSVFEAYYELLGDYEPNHEDIKAFSEGNAVFNVWPFFREFSQNAILRCGYSGLPTLPFLRLVVKEPPQDALAESAAPSQS